MTRGWPKGKPRPEGAGRQKGTPNKLTVSVRQAFKEAFDYLQEDESKPAHLKNWASSNPKEFYAIAQKLIPTEIATPPEGEGQFKVTVEFIKPDEK